MRGPLFAGDEWTGVDVEIRSGGPAIGFQGVPAQMYTDKDILLGWVNTDEAIAELGRDADDGGLRDASRRRRG